MFRNIFIYGLVVFSGINFPALLNAQDTTLQGLLAVKNDTGSIKALLNYGVDLINVDNDKARKVFQVTLERSKQLNYDYGLGSSYGRLGYLEGQAGNSHKAIGFNLTALQHYQKIENTRGIAVSYNNIGFNYDILGMADSAIFYYLEGIEIVEKKKDKPGTLSTLYENVSTLLANRNEIEKAIDYSRKAIDFATANKDTNRLVTAYTGISNVYQRGKDPHSALQAAMRAMNYVNDKSGPVLWAKVYLNLSGAYNDLKEPDSAIAAAKKSMGFSESIDMHNYISAGLGLVDAYAQKKDYLNQKLVLSKLEKKAESTGNLYFLFDIYERLGKVHYAMGDYKHAYAYNVKHGVHKDSFYTEKSRKDVAEIEAKYRTAENEKALAQNQLELSVKDLDLAKSNRLAGFTLAGLVAASLLAASIFLQMRNKKRIFSSELLTLQKQKEIDVLQALMNGEEKERSRISKDLHDGVAGILAASKMHLSSMANENEGVSQAEGYRQGVRLLDEATQEIRKTSHNLMPELLLQHGLDAAIKRYCDLIGKGRSLSVQYDSWGDLVRFNNSFELAVYRIVQELLNNIVKHSNATEAIVQMSHQNGILSVAVEDNGVGFDPGNVKESGMGIYSLQSRVKALNGKMELESVPGNGVNVYLEFETGK